MHLQAELSAGLYRGSWVPCACGTIHISQSGRGLKGAWLSVNSGWWPVNTWPVRCGNATHFIRGAERSTAHRGCRASPSDWRRSDWRLSIISCSIIYCITSWGVCVCFRCCRFDLRVRNYSGCYLEGNCRFLPHVCISLSQDSTLYTTTLILRYRNAQNLHYYIEYLICHSAVSLYICVQPLWRAAVSQFDRLIAPAEQEAAGKLKTFIIDAQDSPQQVHTITLVLIIQTFDFLSLSRLILAKSHPLRQK